MNPVVVIGGGAAGFFGALRCAELNPQRPVVILEQGSHPLAKVKISGGGRCNVTHACFDPKVLVGYYPRGGKALLGPFHKFQPRDTIAWFEKRGVPLKAEPDGRMFPLSNSSQTIIDALGQTATQLGVQVRTRCDVTDILLASDGYRIIIGETEELSAHSVLLATGSGRRGWEWAAKLGHTVEPPIPSLFTFHIPDKRLRGLEGITMPNAEVQVPGTKLKQTGPILITHHGLSGPAILKLSAWGARQFHDAGYHVEIQVNWTMSKPETIEQQLRQFKIEYPKRSVAAVPAFGLPRRLWERLVNAAGIPDPQLWTDLARDQMTAITDTVTQSRYMIRGKSPFKDEFVTCGGVKLDEVDFRTMESQKSKRLYFAGEILDIDAVTGGFNFQNAWSTGWLAGTAMANQQ